MAKVETEIAFPANLCSRPRLHTQTSLPPLYLYMTQGRNPCLWYQNRRWLYQNTWREFSGTPPKQTFDRLCVRPFPRREGGSAVRPALPHLLRGGGGLRKLVERLIPPRKTIRTLLILEFASGGQVWSCMERNAKPFCSARIHIRTAKEPSDRRMEYGWWETIYRSAQTGPSASVGSPWVKSLVPAVLPDSLTVRFHDLQRKKKADHDSLSLSLIRNLDRVRYSSAVHSSRVPDTHASHPRLRIHALRAVSVWNLRCRLLSWRWALRSCPECSGTHNGPSMRYDGFCLHLPRFDWESKGKGLDSVSRIRFRRNGVADLLAVRESWISWIRSPLLLLKQWWRAIHDDRVELRFAILSSAIFFFARKGTQGIFLR